ncbi:hypothetical protein T05_7819, partial [Trichinella murrelli]
MSWQAQRTVHYSQARSYPGLPAKQQDMRLTAEQTRTNSGEQLLVYHSPTNDILIFAIDAGVRHQSPPVSNSTKERTDLVIKLLTVCNLAEGVLPSSEQSSSPIRPS